MWIPTVNCFKSALSAGFLIKLKQMQMIMILDHAMHLYTTRCHTVNYADASKYLPHIPFIHKVLEVSTKYPRKLRWRLKIMSNQNKLNGKGTSIQVDSSYQDVQ